MLRLFIVALLAVSWTSPLCAQMRGGRSGSFGHTSGSPRGGGFGTSGRSFGHFSPRFGGGFGPRFGGFHGGFQRGFHSHFRSSFTFIGGFGYPGFYGGFGYPYYGGWPSAYSYPAYSYPVYSYPVRDSGYDSDLQYSYQQKRAMEELDRLQERVDRLERERASSDVPGASRYEGQGKSASPIILIFRDKHTQKISNYAVAGSTLWIFDEERASKIPLSELDLDATRKANQDRGIELQLPR